MYTFVESQVFVRKQDFSITLVCSSGNGTVYAKSNFGGLDSLTWYLTYIDLVQALVRYTDIILYYSKDNVLLSKLYIV